MHKSLEIRQVVENLLNKTFPVISGSATADFTKVWWWWRWKCDETTSNGLELKCWSACLWIAELMKCWSACLWIAELNLIAVSIAYSLFPRCLGLSWLFQNIYSQLRCNPENTFCNILHIHIGKSCKVWVSLALACHLYVAAFRIVEVCICVVWAEHLLFVHKKAKSSFCMVMLACMSCTMTESKSI